MISKAGQAPFSVAMSLLRRAEEGSYGGRGVSAETTAELSKLLPQLTVEQREQVTRTLDEIRDHDPKRYALLGKPETNAAEAKAFGAMSGAFTLGDAPELPERKALGELLRAVAADGKVQTLTDRPGQLSELEQVRTAALAVLNTSAQPMDDFWWVHHALKALTPQADVMLPPAPKQLDVSFGEALRHPVKFLREASAVSAQNDARFLANVDKDYSERTGVEHLLSELYGVAAGRERVARADPGAQTPEANHVRELLNQLAALPRGTPLKEHDEELLRRFLTKSDQPFADLEWVRAALVDSPVLARAARERNAALGASRA